MNHRRLAVRNRLADYAAFVREHGRINRSDICRIGEISFPQASADIAMLMDDYPELRIRYDARLKTFLSHCVAHHCV